MYDAFLGKSAGSAKEGGRALLPDEIKWLALTHKSFENGALGNSDRLAFLGKRIVDLQTSLALLRAPGSPGALPPAKQVFRHDALENIENMTPFLRDAVLMKTRLARVACSYGIDEVMRWHPRKMDDLQASGEHTVVVHTLYSIIGAVAMHRGGNWAARLAREKVLEPLGLK